MIATKKHKFTGVKLPIHLRTALEKKCEDEGINLTDALCDAVKQYVGVSTKVTQHDLAALAVLILSLAPRCKDTETATRLVRELFLTGTLRDQLTKEDAA